MITILPPPKLLCAAAGLLLGLLPVTWAQDTAVSATLHSFAGTDGSVPAELVEGSDGNFYGTTKAGGFDYSAGSGGAGYGTVFRITPAGRLTTLYAFAGADDGQGPFGLSKGLDGNFYGLTGYGGANGGGTVFRLSPAGELTTLYAATSYLNAAGPLVQDDAGNLYGVSEAGAEASRIFRVTLAGGYTTLHTFSNGVSTASSLTRGSDGNFYGATGSDVGNSGTIYQVTPQGAFTTLHTFTDTDDVDGSFPNGLTLGPDGSLYGTTQGGGTQSNGTVFRITNAGQFSVLYRFTGGSDSGLPLRKLVLGSDGNFYGVTEGSTGPIDIFPTIGQPPMAPPPFVPSVFFQVTPQGVLTPLYASATTIGGFPYGGNNSGLIQGSDGNFYGTDNGGGANEKGSAYKLSVEPHPAFFTGQAPLVNSVDYLAFPNGNVFGYYAFLSNPYYLYHFDLGYEYLYDAKDGQDGIYLYDFASSDFFYTSPTFSFPYLYDFNLKSVLYYYPDPNNPGRYNTSGVRYFYDYATGKIITK